MERFIRPFVPYGSVAPRPPEVSIYTPPVSPNVAHDDTSDSRRLPTIALDSEIANCRRCEGMNVARVSVSAPAYGCLSSPVALIGQSLCEKCMESQIPFTGGSDELIDESIERAGREKKDVFITNAGALPSAEEPPVA